MGRAIEFDYDKAIHKATLAFWKSGYSNTSLRDLLKAMRIGEGSFYNSVKSKKHLYMECLKHYLETVGRTRVAALLSEPMIKLGVRALFKTVLDELDNPAERLEAAKAAREFPSEFQPEVVAGIIGTYMQGLLRMVLVSYDRKLVERQLEVFLTSLGF